MNIFLTGLSWLDPKHWNPLWRSAGHGRQEVYSELWHPVASATVCYEIKKEANGHWVFLQCPLCKHWILFPSTLTELEPGLLQKMWWENSLPRTNTLLMIYGNGWQESLIIFRSIFSCMNHQCKSMNSCLYFAHFTKYIGKPLNFIYLFIYF